MVHKTVQCAPAVICFNNIFCCAPFVNGICVFQISIDALIDGGPTVHLAEARIEQDEISVRGRAILQTGRSNPVPSLQRLCILSHGPLHHGEECEEEALWFY